MKTISLHLPSLAAGGALALLLTLTLGFAQSTRPTAAASQGPSPQPVGGMQGRPAARDIVCLRAGDPAFVVPQGRILVISGIGRTAGSNGVRLIIDGMTDDWSGVGSVMHSLTAGWPHPEGTSLQVIDAGQGEGIISGYLEDA